MKRLLGIILSILPYLLVFVASLFVPGDPDLGWHLKYGEYFFQHGTVLRENIYSTMMVHYHWSNTDWGTDILTYFVYHHFGFFGLAVLGAVVITATFYFFSKAARLTLWDQTVLFPILLYLEQPVNVISFRGQLLSLLLIGVLFFFISLYRRYAKSLLFVIPLFFVWVNLNAEFLLGLALFFVWIGSYLVLYNFKFQISNFKFTLSGTGQMKKSGNGDMRELGYLVCVFILACVVTLFNPFGFGVHQTAISHLGSPLLSNIAEYLPFDMLSQLWWNQIFVCMGLLFSLLFFFFKGDVKKKIPGFVLALLVLLLSLQVRRYAWPAYYLCLSLLAPLTHALRPNKKYMALSCLGLLAIGFLLIYVLKNPFGQYVSYNWRTYCRQDFIRCSPASAEYLLKHPQQGRMLTLYGWGGWLIWNYPQIQPSIDGRMHMWRDSTGYSAFAEYYAYEQNEKEINDSPYDIVYMSTDKPIYTHLMELARVGKWHLVYKDDYAAVFTRG